MVQRVILSGWQLSRSVASLWDIETLNQGFFHPFGPDHGKEPSLKANPTSLFLAAIEMAAIF
jgi:hypothetical protein